MNILERIIAAFNAPTKSELAAKEAAKENAVKRAAVIRKELAMLNGKAESREAMMNEIASDKAEKANNTCPKCGGTNAIHQFKKEDGYLKGSISGSSISALTFWDRRNARFTR